MQPCGKIVQLVRAANCINLDAAVVFISNPAGDADFLRVLRDKPAVSDALYVPRDKPGSSL
jgi:hypothetical protein